MRFDFPRNSLPLKLASSSPVKSFPCQHCATILDNIGKSHVIDVHQRWLPDRCFYHPKILSFEAYPYRRAPSLPVKTSRVFTVEWVPTLSRGWGSLTIGLPARSTQQSRTPSVLYELCPLQSIGPEMLDLLEKEGLQHAIC